MDPNRSTLGHNRMVSLSMTTKLRVWRHRCMRLRLNLFRHQRHLRCCPILNCRPRRSLGIATGIVRKIKLLVKFIHNLEMVIVKADLLVRPQDVVAPTLMVAITQPRVLDLKIRINESMVLVPSSPGTQSLELPAQLLTLRLELGMMVPNSDPLAII